jgi:hypothetical protein
MVIKHFCDCCGQEILANKNHSDMLLTLKLSAPGRAYAIEVQLRLGLDQTKTNLRYSVDPAPEEICLYCLIDAATKLDMRPKPVLDPIPPGKFDVGTS